MRCIKFRAKTMSQNVWVYGLIQTISSDGTGFLRDQSRNCYHISCNTICQFTGLCDKNGWEIYEGDIVEVEANAPYEKGFMGVVKFDECAFWIVNEEKQDAVKLFDEVTPRIVIGNIYETQELIK